jgi:hypothetical protein
MDRKPSDDRAEQTRRETEIERKKASERQGVDREVESITQSVVPGSDAPSRAGITGSGSGADSER